MPEIKYSNDGFRDVESLSPNELIEEIQLLRTMLVNTRAMHTTQAKTIESLRTQLRQATFVANDYVPEPENDRDY
jgi:hypothetical protein